MYAGIGAWGIEADIPSQHQVERGIDDPDCQQAHRQRANINGGGGQEIAGESDGVQSDGCGGQRKHRRSPADADDEGPDDGAG